MLLADDHEFWNNYPDSVPWLPWTWKIAGQAVAREADEAFELYQAALHPEPVDAEFLRNGSPHPPHDQLQPRAYRRFARSFQIDVSPLSFFVLDTRTYRTPVRSTTKGFSRNFAAGGKLELIAMDRWAQNLAGPGVLAVAQTLMTDPARRLASRVADAELPNFGEDFAAVWSSLSKSKHDIVILSGDIHKSQLSWIPPGAMSGHPKNVYEVVSSPLCKIEPFYTRPRGALRAAFPRRSRATFNFDSSGGLNRKSMANGMHLIQDGSPQTYATLSFMRLASTIRCEVAFWPAVGSAQAPLATWIFDLR